MLTFDEKLFRNILAALPEETTIFEEPQQSQYLKEQVFSRCGTEEDTFLLNLSAIDFEAFSLCHVTPSEYIDLVENERCGWVKRFNQFLKSLPSAVSEQKGFF